MLSELDEWFWREYGDYIEYNTCESKNGKWIIYELQEIIEALKSMGEKNVSS